MSVSSSHGFFIKRLVKKVENEYDLWFVENGIDELKDGLLLLNYKTLNDLKNMKNINTILNDEIFNKILSNKPILISNFINAIQKIAETKAKFFFVALLMGHPLTKQLLVINLFGCENITSVVKSENVDSSSVAPS